MAAAVHRDGTDVNKVLDTCRCSRSSQVLRTVGIDCMECITSRRRISSMGYSSCVYDDANSLDNCIQRTPVRQIGLVEF